MSCPLCSIGKREDEEVFYYDETFTVVRTRDLKGHLERVMIVLNEHRDEVTDKEFCSAMSILDLVCPDIFDYTYKVVVIDSKYGSIEGHWYYVVTDLEQDSEDFQMVLYTPWIRVIDVREGPPP